MSWQMQVSDVSGAEARRLGLQVALDAERSPRERNELGQFATPPSLADDIMAFALQLLPRDSVRFLEPSCGSGSFFSALLRRMAKGQMIESAVGIELDDRFAEVAKDLWSTSGLEVLNGDFIDYALKSEYRCNLLVANPPYVRHHHLGSNQKQLLAKAVRELDIPVSGLAGLYVYFLLASQRLLEPGAISAWLIPTEFMDVNYGVALRRYLSDRVSLVRIHRFDPADVQFDDALVSSAVVVFRNEPPRPRQQTSFTYGGTVSRPRVKREMLVSDLSPDLKWSTLHRSAQVHVTAGPVLSDFFRIGRGIATGANRFFIRPRVEAEALGIPLEYLRPILPSPRFLRGLIVETDADGWPQIENQLALIDCDVSADALPAISPALADYFDTAAKQGIMDGYLVRKRSPWYKQERREPPPFLCTYMGRGIDDDRPFRFVWNKSRAIASNMYLMLWPIGQLAALVRDDPNVLLSIHDALLALTGDDLRDGGRVYGGGLHKIEPRELAALNASAIVAIAPERLVLKESDEQLTLCYRAHKVANSRFP